MKNNNMLANKEEFRWSFRKKGSQVFNICKHLLFLMGFAATVVGSSEAFANPVGGSVVSGAATISTSGSTETINQATQNAIINWNSFNIAKGETTRVNQPGVTSTEIEQIFNSHQLSTIDGSLLSNGRIIIINPNGVIIGKNGNINTAGFIASSAALANTPIDPNKTIGALNFSKAGRANARIINKGTITVADTGLVALVAPTVRNDGLIKGNLAKIQLGAADTFGIDFYGDGLINLAVGHSTHKRHLKVQNNGEITTGGGQVLLTAAAASNVVDSVINNAGVIEANSMENVNGEIVLKAPGGQVNVTGTLEATGGSIETSGDYVSVENSASIVASEWTLDPLSIEISNFHTIKDDDFVSAIVLSAELAAGEQITLTTNATATSKQDNNGDIIINNDIVGGNNGLLTLNASNDILFQNGADIYTTVGALNLGALNVTLNAGGSITGAADDTFTTGGGSFTANAGTSVNLAGNISTGAGTITIAGSTGSLAGDITLAGLTTTTGDITVSTDQGAVTLNNGATSASGSITATSSGALAAKTAISTGGAGKVSLTSTGSTVNAAAITAASGNIYLSAGTTDMVNGALTTGAGTISVLAGTSGAGDIDLNASISTAGGAVNLNGPVTLMADDTVNSDGGAVTFDNTVDGSYSLTVDGGDIAFDGAIGGGTAALSSLTASSWGNLTLAGNVTTVDGISLTSTEAVSAQAITTAGGTVDIIANNAVTLAGAVSSGAGHIEIESATGPLSSGDLTTAALTTTSGNISLSSGSDFSGGNISTGALTTTSGNIEAVATNGATTLNGAVTSTSGNIIASATDTLTASGDISTGGNGTVNLTSTGDAVTAQNITTQAGDVTIRAQTAVQTNNIGTTDGGIAITNGGTSDIKTKNLSIVSADGNAGMLAVNANGNLTTGAINVVDKNVTGGTNESVFLTSGSGGSASSLTTGSIKVTSADGNATSLAVNSKQGALTVNGDVTVSNTDGDNSAYHSSAKATLTAKGDIDVTGKGGISVTSTDKNTPNVSAASTLSVTSSAGGVNITGDVTATAAEVKSSDPSVGDYDPATSHLTIQAQNDIVIGGTVTGTATSANRGAAKDLQNQSTSVVSIISTGGDLWLGNATVQSVATDASDQDTYDGNAYNDPTAPTVPTAQTADGGANAATVTLSGANQWYTVTYTADAATSTYGTAATGLSGAVSAPVSSTGSGTPVNGYTGTVAWTTPATALSNANQSYAIDGSGLSGANYNFVQAAGNASALTINRALLDLTATQTYNATTTINASSFETKGKIAGVDGQTLTLSGTATSNSANVGTYSTANGTSAAANGLTSGLTLGNGTGLASNYTLVGGTDTATITQATLTIDARSGLKVYDGTTDANIAPLVIGLQKGDSVTDLSEAFASKNVNGLFGSKLNVVSGYTVNDNNGGNNYKVVVNSTYGTIIPAFLFVDAQTDDKTYDGTTSANATPTVSGLKTGDSITDVTEAFTSKNVNGKNGSLLTVSGYSLSDGNNGKNYIVVDVPNFGTITPAELTIYATTDSKIYDGTTNSSAVATTDGGLVAADAGDLTIGAESFDSANAGPRTLSISGYTLTDAKNYSVTVDTAAGTISPEDIYVTTSDVTKIYDDTTTVEETPSLIVTQGALYKNASNGNAQDTLTATGFAYADANAGTGDKTVTASGVTTADGNNGGNYTIHYTDNTTSTISQADLTVVADSGFKTFGDNLVFTGSEFTTEGTLYGRDAVNGVTLTSNGAPPPARVGNYAINAANATGTGISNYDITYVAGNLTVVAPSVLGNTFSVDAAFRPILSVAGKVIDYYSAFQPIQTGTAVNVSLRATQTADANGLSNIEPAAGGDDDDTNSPDGLANIEPAAGGNGGGAPGSNKGDFACANAFLDGTACTSE